MIFALSNQCTKQTWLLHLYHTKNMVNFRKGLYHMPILLTVLLNPQVLFFLHACLVLSQLPLKRNIFQMLSMIWVNC